MKAKNEKQRVDKIKIMKREIKTRKFKLRTEKKMNYIISYLTNDVDCL